VWRVLKRGGAAYFGEQNRYSIPPSRCTALQYVTRWAWLPRAGSGVVSQSGGLRYGASTRTLVPLRCVTRWSQVVVPALQISAKDLLFGESILHGDYWPRYHTYLRKGNRAWNMVEN
jgi:hypothetical protein